MTGSRIGVRDDGRGFENQVNKSLGCTRCLFTPTAPIALCGYLLDPQSTQNGSCPLIRCIISIGAWLSLTVCSSSRDAIKFLTAWLVPIDLY